MKKYLFFLAGFLILLGTLTLVQAGGGPPKKGDVLPSITLDAPKNTAEKTYLGLSGEGKFKIPQIKARVVVIEVFSMYCPFCQKEAPVVNELYAAIEKNPKLKGNIKIVGIGAGNTPYEVQVFKETYAVSFPLLSDEDFTAHKALGDVRTPYFIAIQINKDGSHKVIYSELGALKGVESFLDYLKKTSGL